MRKILSAVVLVGALMLPSFAFADDAHNQSPTNDKQALCTSIQQFAETVMSGRQNGTPMAGMLNNIEASPDVKDTMTQIIIAAYEKPRYMSEDMKRQSIEDFRDDTFLSCIK